jgi:epoxide hydrolase-like predicted phosphatase
MNCRGLLVDFGGVLTTSVFASFSEFCAQAGLEPETVAGRFREPEGRRLLEALETGRLSEAQFEPEFGALLGVDPDGLIDRMFRGMRPEEPMVDFVRQAKRDGIRTGLLSNSWGKGRYDRAAFPELFDAVVISGEEGIRKPDPEIYALALERMALPAQDIVYVDDLPFNLKPAAALGMATVHHTDPAATLAELRALLYAAGNGSAPS